MKKIYKAEERAACLSTEAKKISVKEEIVCLNKNKKILRKNRRRGRVICFNNDRGNISWGKKRTRRLERVSIKRKK